MRITQCRYDEKRIDKFKYFLHDNQLKDYHDLHAPAIFFGLYSTSCFKTLKAHKGLSIVIWRGTDLLKKNRLKNVAGLKGKNIRHVAISSFIADDLKGVKLRYKFIPIPGVKIDDIPVEKLGNEVYAYMSAKRTNFYGGPILDYVKKHIPFKMNINSSCNKYTRDQLMEVYKNSFIGLRLTQHDGIANQVVELGMMGRKCIHNGNHPNAIRWKRAKDIIKTITQEGEKVGQINKDLSDEVKKYINVGKDWLNTEYWKG